KGARREPSPSADWVGTRENWSCRPPAPMERALISERTKVALQAAKERGVKLGSQAQADANKAAAADRDASLKATLLELGAKSYPEIAQELTSRAIAAPRGGAWNAMTVMRAMKRLEIASR